MPAENSSPVDTLRVVCISDTHGLHRSMPPIPAGDLLLHAGDLTNHGELSQVRDLNDWFGELPHPHKVVIAGNHDFSFDNYRRREAEAVLTNVTYLRDQSVTVEGLKIYGSPWQPWFHDWAFNRRRGPDIAMVWELIPDDTDILLTHGPAHGIGDRCVDGSLVGCEDLLLELHRIQPKLHVFGHIHEAHGQFEGDGWTAVNASINTLRYQPTNLPIVIDLPLDATRPLSG